MKKFSLSIIPRKFNKKVFVADIKQYLVDEFDTNKRQQNEIYDLQDKLKVAKEYDKLEDLRKAVNYLLKQLEQKEE